jgi:hypothetical protein
LLLLVNRSYQLPEEIIVYPSAHTELAEVALQAYIPEVLASNLRRDTYYPGS